MEDQHVFAKLRLLVKKVNAEQRVIIQQRSNRLRDRGALDLDRRAAARAVSEQSGDRDWHAHVGHLVLESTCWSAPARSRGRWR